MLSLVRFASRPQEPHASYINAFQQRSDSNLMKIATFNVNGINGRLPILLRWLAEARPDVVCLQELKTLQEKFPEAAIREAGYRAILHGQKSWNSVAILARLSRVQLQRKIREYGLR